MASGGVIYASGIPGRPYVKIGKTTGAVTKRLAALQSGQASPHWQAALCLMEHRICLSYPFAPLKRKSSYIILKIDTLCL
jgi:hypothetical protein